MAIPNEPKKRFAKFPGVLDAKRSLTVQRISPKRPIVKGKSIFMVNRFLFPFPRKVNFLPGQGSKDHIQDQAAQVELAKFSIVDECCGYEVIRPHIRVTGWFFRWLGRPE